MTLHRSASQPAKNTGSQFACQLLEAGRPRYVVVRFKHKGIEAYDIATKATEFSFLLDETQLDLEAGPRPGTTGFCVVHMLSSKSYHLVGPSKTVSGMLETYVATKDTPSEEQRVPTYRYRSKKPTNMGELRSVQSLPGNLSPSMRLSIPQTRDAASSPMVPLAKDLPEDYDGSAPSEELTPQKNSEPAPGDVSGDLETLENEVSELSSELEQLKAERDDLRSTEVCRVRVTQGRTTVRGVHSSAVAGVSSGTTRFRVFPDR
eukprot:1181637-Prorocentrum_minimum.AAC.3